MRKLPRAKYVPVMKGNPTAFTCLGNWYDLQDPESMQSLHCTLQYVTSPRDLRTAVMEIDQAHRQAPRVPRTPL